MTSVALLGDSIFDNKAYVGTGPDVGAQLRAALEGSAEPWRVTLCAVDGTTTQDVGTQLGRVPAHVTHIVLSLGGNDALEMCTEPADYANDIEPGVRGGEKIARAIARAVTTPEGPSDLPSDHKSGIRLHAFPD